MHNMILKNPLLAAACALTLSACGSIAPPPSAVRQVQTAAPVASARALVENAGAKCVVAPLAGYAELKDNPKLPNPFVGLDGRTIKTKQDWTCRRAELAAQVQEYELGVKPPAGAAVQGSADAQGMLVTVTHNGKTISFPVKITLPATGKAPYPAMIGIGMVSLNHDELLRQGVAIINFPNNEVGAQMGGASRGKGKFFDLYGADHTASAMTAWAWGVSRTIDALEKTPGLNATRIGVTGCSRNGKGAIAVGALDERIALTIAQESGSGGAAGWRVSDAQRAAGQNVQTLQQIVTENVWFTDSFKQFGQSAKRLPFDQHSVMALIAPRALLVVENTSMEWLGNQSAYINAVAAREVWKALAVPNAMGIDQVGGHNHCQLPVSQFGAVNSFVKRYLLGDSTVDTNVQKTDGTFSTDTKLWIDWKTPVLE